VSTRLSLGIVFTAFAISGCMTPEQQAARTQRQQEQAKQEEEAYFSSLRARCKNYGFSQGTDAFAQCVQREVEKTPTPQAQRERAKAVNDCALAMMGMPTRSGNFGESMAYVNMCNSDPDAAKKLQERRSEGYVCSPGSGGTMVCQRQ
jgi:hypothetical protein